LEVCGFRVISGTFREQFRVIAVWWWGLDFSIGDFSGFNINIVQISLSVRVQSEVYNTLFDIKFGLM